MNIIFTQCNWKIGQNVHSKVLADVGVKHYDSNRLTEKHEKTRLAKKHETTRLTEKHEKTR